MMLFDWMNRHTPPKKGDGGDEDEQKPLQSPPESPGPEAGDYTHPGIEIPGETESADSALL